jgi:Calx-beta domain
VTVNYTTANGTAVQPGDYTLTAGTLTFPQGSTELTIDVPIVSDTLVENNETFSLLLSAPVGATLLKPKGQGTILDDDAGGKLEFAAPVFAVTEGSQGIVTVKRADSLAGTVRVNYATSDGSAVAGQDYTARSGILTFTPGVATRTFMVPTVNNLVNKPDNTLLVTLSNPTGGSVIGAQGTAAVSIVDNDVSTFSFMTASYTTREGALATRVYVRRSGTFTNAATVDYVVTGGTATQGSDYALGGSGTLTFPARSVLQSFDFQPIDDNIPEAPETVTLSLTNPVSLDSSIGAQLGTLPTTAVTILDNEPTIQFLATTLNVSEPAPTAAAFPTAMLVVRRSSGVGTATVDYTLGGTATPGPGGDYLPPGSGSGPWTLTFLPGAIQQVIPLTILPDHLGEPSETIEVTLANAVGAGLGPNTTATVTVLDAQPKVQFALASYTFAEGTGLKMLTVTRTSAVEQVTVDYKVTGGTATPGARFTLPDGTLTFAPKVLTQQIPVQINQDAIAQGDETVLVTLSNPVGATVGTRATTVLTITDGVDDAPAVFFSPTAYTVSEAVRSALVTVKRSGPLTAAASVSYNVTGGTATEGFDFSGGHGSVLFLPGQFIKTFPITIIPDTIVEGSETIELTLSSPSPGTALGTQQTAVVTITDNDSTGIFSFSAPSYSVNEAGTTATITVKRVGALSSNVGVHFATSDGTATAGSDYTTTSGDLIFGVGKTSMTFQVPITNDTVQEADETILLTLTPSTPTAGELPATIGQGAATLTIVDDDSIGAFSFSAPTFSVGESAGAGVVTVTRSGAGSGTGGPGSSVAVHYATSALSAANGVNYADTSGDLTFAAGETSKTFAVTVMDDAIHGPDKTVALTLSAPTGGATLGPQSSSVLWVVDEDPGQDPINGGTIQFTAPVFTVKEGVPFVTVTVLRSGPTTAAVKVNYATSNGTAIAGPGLDYTAASGVLTFTAGMTARSFNVPIVNNLVYKADDTFLVTLSNPTGGAVLGPQATAAVSILDNDASVFSFSTATYTTREGILATKVFVRRAGTVTNAATVDYAVTGGTATLGSDYTAGPNGTGSGTLTFPARSVLQTFDFVPIDDNLPESPETAVLSLTNATSLDPNVGASVGTPATTVVTILDNEPTIQFFTTALKVSEPPPTAAVFPTATLLVRRSSSIGTATVDYALAGTATPGGFLAGDYQPPAANTGGTLLFLPGEIQKTIPFTIWPDDVGEPAETIDVTLSNAVGAGLGAKISATVTILDAQPRVQFALASYKVAESTPTVNLLVTRTSAAEQVVVNYEVTGGTATPGRYSLPSGSLTFDAGVISKTIPVTINQDSVAQGDETVLVTLSLAGGANATLGTISTTVLTITDGLDDAPSLFFSPSAYAVSEAAPSVLLTVRRSGPPTGWAQVFYSVTGGTAVQGLDFLGGNGVLVFTPGVTARTFPITLTRDTIVEGPETIDLALSSVSGAVLGTQSTAVVTINDDDSAGVFSFSAPTYSVSESGFAATITVKRTGGVASDVRVHYATSDGTATAGSDYTNTSGDLVFAAGVTTMTFQVPIADDSVQEGDETLHLTLTPGTPNAGELPATIGLGSATLTIEDDDTIGAFSFSAPAFSVGEKQGAAFVTVTRTGAASGNGGPVTVHYATAAGTASNGINYSDTSGDLTFAPGETSKTFQVTVMDDAVPTLDKTVALVLSAPGGGATLGAQSSAVLWIVDQD